MISIHYTVHCESEKKHATRFAHNFRKIVGRFSKFFHWLIQLNTKSAIKRLLRFPPILTYVAKLPYEM